MARNRILYLICLGAAFIFHLYYYAWFSWYVLLLAIGLPVFSLLVSIPAMLKTQLSVKLPASANRGDEVILDIGGRSDAALPAPSFRLRLTAEDVMTGAQSRQRVALSGGGSRRIRLSAAHCGAVVCRLDRGGVFDYLGLFRMPLAMPDMSKTVIEPISTPPKELPNLSHFQYKTYHPKNGGGFSEIHDMRDYRPGDSMRDIHWKLSAKTDRLIVREPQEPDEGLILLTFDLREPRRALDGVLDNLLWLSGWLLSRETSHYIRWLDPATLEVRSAYIQSAADLDGLVSQLLHSRIGNDIPSIADMTFANVSWRCHVSPEKFEADNA